MPLALYNEWCYICISGVNLCAKQFRGKETALISRAQEAGVNGIITISNSQRDWKFNLRHCKRLTKEGKFQVKATLGIHPHDAKAVFREGGPTLDTAMKELENLIREDTTSNHIVAVGECGLDYDRMFSPAEQQREVFRKQIEIAAMFHKPLYLHERKAHEDFWNILVESKEKYPDLKGIVHCYTSDEETMNKYLSLGLYIGITGWICDSRRNRQLLKAVTSLPLEKLIIETDSPFLAPPETKQRKNEPCSLPYVCRKLAEAMGHQETEIYSHARMNVRQLFGF